MSNKDFEREKEGLFQLIDTWNPKNIRLAFLLIKNNPALQEAAKEHYGELLHNKGYKRLMGLRSLAMMKHHSDWSRMENYDEPQYRNRLDWLYLHHADLHKFPDNYLEQLVNLKIHSYSIKTIDAKLLGQLKSLEYLWLSNCKRLENLPKSLLELPNLCFLAIDGTALGFRTGVHRLHTASGVRAFLETHGV